MWEYFVGHGKFGKVMMMKKLAIVCTSVLALTGCNDQASSGQGGSRDQIKIVGSSTVFPFAKAVAEQFQNLDPSYKTPVLESTGTGGGMELFCNGVGPNTPDIVNASRRMKKSEYDRCQQNGVKNISEFIVGIDGIAIAESNQGKKFALTTKQIYEAIAANPYGKPNTSVTWSDIDASLPAIKIHIYGPPSTSGTRDALEELIMEPGCKTDAAVTAMKTSDEKKYDAVCHEIRTDGAYVDAGENDNLIIQKLAANPDSLGIFGYSYLEANLDKVHGIPIGGVAPTYDAISGGSYPGARPLYIYVKGEHVGVIPNIKQYVAEFLKAGGSDGYLKKDGLITSPDAVREKMIAAVDTMPPLGGSELK